ncbi:sodium-dependent lysophosphatidylcholine symporter 1-A-like [Salvelinus fontinalis]|uniref:sodium-dependent lysophosphatidylcholine symporter 1-A-like n=1 Tax=Salvelinus fontinalis TaxID=8038 RepID=UPI0024860F45|nr:sodium-dependent lysophosphatidylcholine symporter 1-A-like [Salvelinus fontinalis]
MSQAYSVPWYLTANCLFETLMTSSLLSTLPSHICINVPSLSLNMRQRLCTAYRMSVEKLAMLVASVIQGQVEAVFYTEKAGACQQLDQSQELPHNTPSPQTDVFGELCTVLYPCSWAWVPVPAPSVSAGRAGLLPPVPHQQGTTPPAPERARHRRR